MFTDFIYYYCEISNNSITTDKLILNNQVENKCSKHLENIIFYRLDHIKEFFLLF